LSFKADERGTGRSQSLSSEVYCQTVPIGSRKALRERDKKGDGEKCAS
jgi:hypothetical protein